MNHLQLLKKLLVALDEETAGYTPIGYLRVIGRLTDEEYAELKKLELEAMEDKHD